MGEKQAANYRAICMEGMMENLISLEDLSSDTGAFTREQTLELRSQYIPKVCKLHFESSPMKVIRANGQYLYDDNGLEYLDCVNCVAHVGHCNPTVVAAAKTAMLQMGNVSLGTSMSDTAAEYVAKLKTTFPPEIDTFLFVSSASEANDLAIQMARQYTGGYDVVSVESGFHGGLSETTNVSPRQFSSSQKCPEWVHVLRCPDLYRGRYRGEDPEEIAQAVVKYCEDATQTLEMAVHKRLRKLACFICEPVITVAGVIIPPEAWLHSVYSTIRSLGGVCIADEAQTGLGRCGHGMWSFQMYEDLIPDIVTIGKPLGNGHPMACICTRREIALRLVEEPGMGHEYACDVVSAAVGLAVLNTVRANNLQMNARRVGEFLREGIRSLATKHGNIGQVRGTGLMIGVEIVACQETRKPAQELAERICYKLLEHYIIVANDGIHKNVLILTPPMCFNCENAHRVIRALDQVLRQISEEWTAETRQTSPTPSTSRSSLTAGSVGSTFSGDRLLSLEDIIGLVGSSMADNERPSSSSSSSRFSSSNDGEAASSSSSSGAAGIVTKSSSPATTSLDEHPDDGEENDDGGYVTSHSFASMD